MGKNQKGEQAMVMIFRSVGIQPAGARPHFSDVQILRTAIAVKTGKPRATHADECGICFTLVASGVFLLELLEEPLPQTVPEDAVLEYFVKEITTRYKSRFCSQ